MMYKFEKYVFDVHDQQYLVPELNNKFRWIYGRAEEIKNRVIELHFPPRDSDYSVKMNSKSTDVGFMLTIGILSTPERLNYLYRLIAHIQNILTDDIRGKIQIILNVTPKEITTGEKRNQILYLATGKYLCFIDDDDLISSQYFTSIFEALKTDCDAVGFNGIIYKDNNPLHKFVHSNKANGKYWKDGIHYCYINHLNPVRTQIAKQIKFPHIWFGEDAAYWENMSKSNLIKNEYYIDDVLYHYIWRGHYEPQNK